MVHLMPCGEDVEEQAFTPAALPVTWVHRKVPVGSDILKSQAITTGRLLLRAKPKSSGTQYIQVNKRQLQPRGPTELSAMTGMLYVLSSVNTSHPRPLSARSVAAMTEGLNF